MNIFRILQLVAVAFVWLSANAVQASAPAFEAYPAAVAANEQ